MSIKKEITIHIPIILLQVAFIYAHFEDISWLYNIGLLCFWALYSFSFIVLSFIIISYLFFINDEEMKKNAKDHEQSGSKFKKYFNILMFFVWWLALGATGHFWLASIALVNFGMIYTINGLFEEFDKRQNKLKKQKTS